MSKRRKFWNFVRALGQGTARLVLSGVIDTGTGWYEDTVTPQEFRDELDACAGMDLTVEINSPGGDVFAGYEIYNMLCQREGRTRVLVTGFAASAASIVAMAADEGDLQMCECSMMMVHNPWTCTGGNASDLRREADVLDLIRDTMLVAYMQRFKGSEEEMIALLDKETYLDPARAVELGLADSVAVLSEDENETLPVSANMLGRYAALDVDALREKWGVPRHKRAAAPQPPKAAASQKPPEDKNHGQDAHDYLAEVDDILAAIDNPDGNIPSVF